MLSFLLIYWIWKPFSNLAMDYNKNKWKYFFLGLCSYVFTALFFIIIYIVVIGLMKGSAAIHEINYNSGGLNLLFSAIGILGCYGVYKTLEVKLKKEKNQ